MSIYLNSRGTEPGFILFSALNFFDILLSVLQRMQTCNFMSTFIFLFDHASWDAFYCTSFLFIDLWIFLNLHVSFLPLLSLTLKLTASAQLIEVLVIISDCSVLLIFNPKKTESSQFDPSCGFPKTSFSKERVKPWFFVTFNIIIRYKLPENFIEIAQIVWKIWRSSSSIITIKLYWYLISYFLNIKRGVQVDSP